LGADHTDPGLKATRRSISCIEHLLAERREEDASSRNRPSCEPIEQRDEGEE
jgi:hypothetical protein